MKIVIFGAGYVGTVSGACLANCGNDITFIEPNLSKVEDLNKAKSPILEPGLTELIHQGVEKGVLRAKQALTDDLNSADIAMIAVATPSQPNGSLQLNQMKNVLEAVTKALEKRKNKLIIAIRSTIHPLALRKLIRECCLDENKKICIVVNPEFLRESTAVHDFFHAPFCVAGGEDTSAVNTVLSLYKQICPQLFALNLEEACLLKYACNAFHALKICFANEIGSVCDALEIDSVALMKVFCHDNILNCSSAYLKPGFAFGGSCLPKDLRALLSLARELEETLPLLSAILPSNNHRFQKILVEIMQNDHQNLAILGMSFKIHNDDLRESPFVELIEYFIGKGINVKVYDPDVHLERLTGSNLNAFNYRYTHLGVYLQEDLKSTLEGCDGIVLCKNLISDELFDYLEIKQIPLYDLQRSLSKRGTCTTI